jgi:hypothetical protein
MPDDPRIRASDEDRDRTAALLREHHAVGRLTPAEFGERLDQAYSATTIGDLDALLADLPGIDLYQLPHASLPRYQDAAGRPVPAPRPGAGPVVPGGRFAPAWLTAWGSWAAITLVTFLVWLGTGVGFPWFLLVAGPTGIVLLARWLSGAPRRG